MPPKESKKAIEKHKQKVIEDKTFGLKNKNKSKKVEQFIKSVTSQAQNKGADRKAELAAAAKKEEKARAEQAKKELAELFKPVIQQKAVPVGVDPKSIVCEYFRQGACTKGNKCKFAHDLKVERKAEKIDFYTDRRGAEEETMEDWDDAQLNKVVNDKQTVVNKQLKTTIVCKYFLDAIEQKKYGWFWECPNGGDKCLYVHALPPGFVLKTKGEEKEEEEEETTIEEIIEEQRRKLVGGTPVTLETFKKWKEDKRIKKEADERAAEEKRQADIKSGKTVMSGREMFVFNPDLFVDDDAAMDMDDEDLGPDDDEAAPEYVHNVDNLGRDLDGVMAALNTTTTSDVDQVGVQVDKSLFIGGDEDLPDDDE